MGVGDRTTGTFRLELMGACGGFRAGPLRLSGVSSRVFVGLEGGTTGPLRLELGGACGVDFWPSRA